jgi:hypothetical protein
VYFHVGSTSGEKEREKQKIELGTFQNLERSGKQKNKQKKKKRAREPFKLNSIA